MFLPYSELKPWTLKISFWVSVARTLVSFTKDLARFGDSPSPITPALGDYTSSTGIYGYVVHKCLSGRNDHTCKI